MESVDLTKEVTVEVLVIARVSVVTIAKVTCKSKRPSMFYREVRKEALTLSMTQRTWMINLMSMAMCLVRIRI